jgi:hypothetical protein
MSDSASNPKSRHLEEGEAFGFDESGERVPLTWPDGGQATPHELTVETLMDACNFSYENAETAARVAGKFFTATATDSAQEMASAALRKLLLDIARTKTGKTPEFRAIMAVFTPQKTAASIAKEANISRQRLAYWTRKLRPFFLQRPHL